MIIYFIQEEEDGPVKIGQTSNLIKRLATLQIGSPRQLRVRYSFEVPDEKADYAEKHLHHCFRNRRMKGEWFSPCPYMDDYIKAISERGFFQDWMDDLHEYFQGDTFSDIYNQTFHAIEKIRAYGDIRRINDLIDDLGLLLEYAKTGRM